MDHATPADEHVLVERQGPIVTLTWGLTRKSLASNSRIVLLAPSKV